MDPRVIHHANEGPQVAYLTQSRSRGIPPSDIPRVADHVPWTVRWEEYPATEVLRDGTVRFAFPSEGDLLHAAHLVLTIRGMSVPLPAGANLIRDVTVRCDGEVIDRVEGEWVAIDHDCDREGNRHVGRDALEYNNPSITLDVGDDEETDIIVDLPLFFRDRASVSRGVPLFLLRSDRHELHVRTRYPCRLPEDYPYQTTLPGCEAPKHDTWNGRVSTHGGIVHASIIYEISDLPTRDRYGIRGFQGSLLSSRIPNPGWRLPVITRTFMEISLQGRRNHSVILPFQNELVGIVFALRPIFHQRAGRNTRFDNFRYQNIPERDLDEDTLDVLYTTPEPYFVEDKIIYPPAELLQEAQIVVGNTVLERREALWWRQESWQMSSRTPPTRTRFVYGRFWDVDPRIPSGGTFLEHVPRTELRLTLNDHTPDCTLLLWGLTRTTAEIHDQVLRIKDLHA